MLNVVKPQITRDTCRLSALKHDNGALTARVTTQRGRSKRRSTSGSAKEIRQVIAGLEDDLGVLTLLVTGLL